MKNKSIFDKYYLKDVLDINSILQEGYTRICILAGVGAGKSTWVEEVLSKMGNVLWVTSRKAPVEQVTGKSQSIFKKSHIPHINNNQTHVTNALLAKIIQDCMRDGRHILNEFISYYDFIVIDEAHSLVSDSTFAESSMTVLNFAEYVSSYIHKPVIFMTGTPEPIQYYLDKNDWHIYDFRKTCNYVHPSSVCFIRKKDISKTISKASELGNVIYFVNHIEDIAKIYNTLLSEYNFKLENIGAIVSQNSISKLKTTLKQECKAYFTARIKEELQASYKEESASLIQKGINDKIKHIVNYNELIYESLVNTKKLPESCKVLLSTSTLREGVSIFNNNMSIICDNHILSNIIQFWGRIRLEGAKVYMVEDSTSHTSNLNNMLYECAIYRADACNKYLQYIESHPTIETEDKKAQYIDYTMKSNHYVYFNWIANKFFVAHNIYREENRIKSEELYWIARLRAHCKEFHIKIPAFSYKEFLKENLPTIIMKAVKENTEFTGTSIQTITNMINDFCRTTYFQHSKLSLALQQNSVNVEIIAATYNTAEHRGETYWRFTEI